MRLGIFLFYDGKGEVSDHVVYLLAKFSEHIDRLVIVCNGAPATGEDRRLSPYADQIIVRENKGFDVGGYIDGILSVGFDDLAEYDELVLFNYTVFGPMFDLGEMFSAMAQRDVDFWGVTEFRDSKKEFLQSYFLVTRRSLHTSSHFRDYWLTMPKIETVDNSVNFHEFRFTPHFVELGYKKGVYVENDPTWHGNTTLLDLPALLDRRLPILKYRAFNFDASAIERRGGRTAASNFDLIAERTDYPIDFIWAYIISQTPVDQIIDSITQVAVVDERPSSPDCPMSTNKTVIFLSVEDERYMEKLASYLMKHDTKRIYAVSSKEPIVAYFSSLGWNVRKSSTPYTGAPICAFADQVETIVAEDDTVFNLSCFFGERDNYLFREFLVQNYWGPLLSSPANIDAIAAEFKAQPRIGMFFAPTESVFGRTTRLEPLCPRASNWLFDTYPKHVQGALDQSNWAWRGNAALSGRLARNATFIARLGDLYANVKHRVLPKISGIEGSLAELARGVGYAAKLIVSSDQAVKLLSRGALKEKSFRNGLQQQANALSKELLDLRKALPAAAADGSKPGSKESSSTDPTVVKLQAELTKAKKKNADAEARLTQLSEERTSFTADLQAVLARLTPARLREAAFVRREGDAIVLVRTGSEETDRPEKSSYKWMASAFGSISVVLTEEKAVQVKGWCYNSGNLEELTFVAVANGNHIVREFAPCLLYRANLSAKIGRTLSHEHSGFSFAIPFALIEGDTSSLNLLVAGASADQIFIAPLKEGHFGEWGDDSSLAGNTQQPEPNVLVATDDTGSPEARLVPTRDIDESGAAADQTESMEGALKLQADVASADEANILETAGSVQKAI